MFAQINDLSFVTHCGRQVAKVPTELNFSDKLGAFKVRFSFGRMNYTVEPGLYAVGNPDSESHVLVTANYKLTFDFLRKELAGLDLWILVLDTRGINVWCAAGKGTFGTDELVERIEAVGLKDIVKHRRLILPQLGAVGIAAHHVKKRSGFSVIYGPIYARDIIAFFNAGTKATEQMRQVRFSFYDRLILTPVEFVMGIKYFLIFAMVMLILSGLSRQWYSPELIVKTGVRSLVNLLIAYLAGAVAGPVLLPWLPGRSFSFKGMVAGLILVGIVILARLSGGRIETAGWIFVFASVGSFGTMNFTGASTYTSLSGVKKEMRVAVPLQLVAIVIGVGLWIAARFV
jgi:hypothetical protein